ncbi:MAG: L-seryl-tRNA(Ser) seleniumtransferase [Pseudohongiellaceae bacterium]|jgi:L-seryl-tRNA(Ser) seleniumtransferase
MNSQASAFKLLPSVDKLLQKKSLTGVIEALGHDVVKLKVRAAIERLRTAIAANDIDLIAGLASSDFVDSLCVKIVEDLNQESASTLVAVFNLTGTVIHTNLGRARMPEEAVKAMAIAASQSTNLEFDLETGKRGDRDSHLEKCLCEMTGAEAATVVNNNAAAVVLVLNSLALQKEVLISRGELVEIGGAFRIPEVMKSANCILKEVGTTNRTHLRDFADAIDESTGLMMKVHTSNYEIRGFTKSVSEAQLSELSSQTKVPFVSDLGSGTLVDLRQYGLPYEPTVKDTVDTGADLVLFSGDKLLGGPQAGIIVGKKQLIDKIKRNPLKRALRIDKVTLAGLVEVINLYKDPRRLSKRLPILKDLTRPLADINALAQRVLPRMASVLEGQATVSVQECKSQIGSGALPLDLLDSRAIVIKCAADKTGKDAYLTSLSLRFRRLPKPVVGRIHDGALIFDLRCLYDEEEFLNQLELIKTG